MTRIARIAPIAFTLALAAGCRTAPRATKFTPVAEADFGRLAPEQMAPVDAARAEVAAARDAVARARLRQQEAANEEGYARADQASAQADALRAQADQRVAKESGDVNAAARAQELAEAAALRRAAADAHLDYGRQLVAAYAAAVGAAEARVGVAEAALERARLTALADAGIPAASKYDPARFDAHVAQAQRAGEQARARAAETSRAATAARDRWRGLEQRYQARVEGLRGRG